MSVGELIKRLSEFDPRTQVRCFDSVGYEEWNRVPVEVIEIRYVEGEDAPEYYEYVMLEG